MNLLKTQNLNLQKKGALPEAKLPQGRLRCSLDAKARLTSVLVACIFISLHINKAMGEIIASDAFDYSPGILNEKAGGVGWAESGWKASSNAACYICDATLAYQTNDGEELGEGQALAFNGTGSRYIPLRRELAEPYTDDTLFIRFLIRYKASSLDDINSNGNGEFFILWLDDIDGGDGAQHTVHTPHIGLTNPKAQNKLESENHFMVRLDYNNPSFCKEELEGDRTYLIVAKLSKKHSGALSPYTKLELWVDPQPEDRKKKPDAIVDRRTINSIRWLGFATGKKTEPADFILVDDLVLGEHWQDVLPGAKEFEEPGATLASVSSDEERIDFRRDVYPILKDRCFDCHQGRDASSGFRFDVRAEILGHFQGEAQAIPGDSGSSNIYKSIIETDEDLRMPQYDESLPEDEIAIIKAWIDQGLDWDSELLPSDSLASDHWSFQKVERPDVPEVKNQAWVRNPIDAFIVNQQEALGVQPATKANRRTLLRRITLDLTGLPPTPEEIQNFLNDDSPHAVNTVVERLLSTTLYGEHWGRHWLDIARWAESDGYQHNKPRPTAWKYRDYVTRSFKENKPFDRFILEQLAGDEILPYADDNIIATHFLAATQYSGNERDEAIQRNDVLTDITNTTANAFLGITMQCAQCHSHKFDPIDARDYYRFQGFFVKGQPLEVLLHGDEAKCNPEKHQEILSAVEEQLQMLADSAAKLVSATKKQGLPSNVTQDKSISTLPKEQKKRFKEFDKQIKEYDRVWTYYSPVTSATPIGAPYLRHTSPLTYSIHQLQRAKPRLLIRGDINTPGPLVDVGWPAVFGSAELAREAIEAHPRTELAKWLVDRNNPLTARVWVNRMWLYHFGRGLVLTPSDFGTQGERPSHPELLDWLAVELIESGWDTGHIHKLILTSNTYQQSSRGFDGNQKKDPSNISYWHWEPRRLEAESIRDSILAVSGLLDTTVGGPSIPLQKRNLSKRRTTYLEQRRGRFTTIQKTFDAPTSLTTCSNRRTSTVPLQPLYLLNAPIIYSYAEAFAERVVGEASEDIEAQQDLAFKLAVGRIPTDKEKQVLHNYYQQSVESAQKASDEELQVIQRRCLVQLCHGLLNLNEFLYIM